MKRTFSVFFFVLIAALCAFGCTDGGYEPKTTTSAVSTTASSATTVSFSETIDKYVQLYNATDKISDMFMAEKVWLVSRDNIVQLISISGFDSVAVIPRSSVERVEQTSVGVFATVTVVDKTGQEFTISVDSSAVFDVMALLKQ